MNKRVEVIAGVYPNQVSLDLEANAVSIALQYSIDDVRNIDKKNTNYSKTITLPGTKKNNLAFGGLFDVNSTFDQFNPNLKTTARIVVDSSPVLEGYLQLKSVKKLNNADLQGNKISYEVVVFDDSVDFMQSIGDKLVSQLDFSDKNHTYNQTNIENAWNNNTFEDVYQYPLLDKITEGYKTEDFKPAFYHKALLLKIAEESSYALEGSFIDNTQYDKEIILWDGDTPKITDSQALQREFNASTDVTGYTVGSFFHNNLNLSLFGSLGYENIDYNIITPLPNFDYTGGYNFNQSGGSKADYSYWQCNNAGKYDFYLSANFTIDYEKVDTSKEGTVYRNNREANEDVYPQIIARLVEETDETIVYSSSSFNMPKFNDLPIGTDSDSSTGDAVFKFSDVNLPLNAKVKISYTLSSSARMGWGYKTIDLEKKKTRVELTFKYNLSANSYWYNKTIQVENITDGDEIEISQYLPKEIKQKDIISDIVKRYNVYIRKHPTKNKTLILESRDDYYKNNVTVLDWTQKKDYSSEDNIKFLSDLQAKEILFTYKEANGLTGSDGGKYNEKYKQSTGDIYGQKKISFNNDFVKGTKKIESIFSTTPLVFRGDTDTKNNVVVPSVSSEEKKRKPVLSYWGGLINCKDEDGVDSNFNITWGEDTTATVYTTYPYSGHWDNPYNPTIDIHYGSVTYEYYGILLNQYTDNNLFNKYWSNYYTQISTNGKLITSRFYLKETDINFIKDNLNARIFIKDSYYNINKITDYKPLEDGLTTVELLRIEQGSDFTPTTSSNPFDSTSIDTSLAVTSVGPFISSPENEVSSINVMALGVRNYVGSGSSGIINGNDNVIGGNSTGVNITGNNNTVGAGVSNVTIVGDNQTVNESDTSVINGNVINTETTGTVFKELEIGSWDMDLITNIGVSHSLSATEWGTIRNVEVSIIDDADTFHQPLENGGLMGFGSSTFSLQRTVSGTFDNTNYDDSTINRGFIRFYYIAD